MGRKKIEMKKIDDETARLVTFSKRRLGLFKKASELSILCGAEAAILVFSESDKVYSFGHPCVYSVVDKFLIQNILPEETFPRVMDNLRGNRIHELNQEMTELHIQLEEEKKRRETLLTQGGPWLETAIENLDMPQLKQLMLSIGELRKNAIKQVNMIARNSTQAAEPLAARSAANNSDVFPHGYDYERGHF
ncbi:agamous-like MADS-box protein AGL62 [Macadamia integrifolia]|uniref:agamous-like MADS-box protein AGL62 n=1 Tax=Macadamia integrifolia TaxID=60698 RepID=UPI001C4F1F02|nr:agamous-like MADS-box protein AGL62 [Macadamia integrifolia]